MKKETKGEATKQHLINVGSVLFHQQGYKNTGLSQILKESGVTKGSFYFHFEGGFQNTGTFQRQCLLRCFAIGKTELS